MTFSNFRVEFIHCSRQRRYFLVQGQLGVFYQKFNIYSIYLIIILELIQVVILLHLYLYQELIKIKDQHQLLKKGHFLIRVKVLQLYLRSNLYFIIQPQLKFYQDILIRFPLLNFSSQQTFRKGAQTLLFEILRLRGCKCQELRTYHLVSSSWSYSSGS